MKLCNYFKHIIKEERKNPNYKSKIDYVVFGNITYSLDELIQAWSTGNDTQYVYRKINVGQIVIDKYVKGNVLFVKLAEQTIFEPVPNIAIINSIRGMKSIFNEDIEKLKSIGDIVQISILKLMLRQILTKHTVIKRSMNYRQFLKCMHNDLENLMLSSTYDEITKNI